MLNMSPLVLDAPPPSPACIVMPGTLRSASVSVVAPCSSRSVRGMTWIVWGVSAQRRGVLRRFDAGQRAAHLDGVGAHANLDRHRRRIREAIADARSSEERGERLLDAAHPGDARRGQQANPVFRERDGHARDLLERLEHDVERAGRDIERPWLRLCGAGLEADGRRVRQTVLPEEERERLARRPDLDVGEGGLEPPRLERDAALDRQRERAVIGGVQRGDGADDGADDDEGRRRAPARRLSLASFHDCASAWVARHDSVR